MGSISKKNDTTTAQNTNSNYIGVDDLSINNLNHGDNQNTISIEVCNEHAKQEQQNQQSKQQQVQLSDFVGEHGAYQFGVTILLFFRYVLLGLMANSGPLMTPDVTFYCSLPMVEIMTLMPNISTLNKHEQELEIKEEFKQICQIDLHLYQNQSQLQALNSSKSFRTSPLAKVSNLNLNFSTIQSERQTPRIRECVDFTYDVTPDQGTTMTSEFDLVCDRDWLRSLFQSLLSASIVVAHVFWGTFSDKYGRFEAQRLCLIVSLIAGVSSIFAMNFWTFTLTRVLCSFGDLGLVVSQTTSVVELVGQRYRGSSVALVNFGFALGVSLLPYLMAHFEDFRLVIGVSVLCHMITMPFILATSESPLWLLTNRRFKAARKELKMIARWNKTCTSIYKSISWPFLFNNQGSRKKLRVSSKEQKQRFDRMFNDFIKQFESQNLYDPVAAGDHVEPSKADHRSVTDRRKHLAIIQQQPQTGEHLLDDSVKPQLVESVRIEIDSNDKLDLPNSNGGDALFADQAHLSQPAVIPSTLSRAGQRLHCLENRNDVHSDNDSTTSDKNNESNNDNTKPVRHAISCDRLDASSINTQDSANSRMNQIDLNQRQVKYKTLTLPIVSQASSVYESEEADDLFHGPIRRRKHETDGTRQQLDCIASCDIVAHQLSFVGRVSRLFKDKKLMIAVFTIVWTTFNSELLYTSFIIINLEVGEDLYFNYMLGACMEALAAICASLLLSYSPRRVSLIAFWLLISISCFGLSLAHIDSTWAVWMLALAKFSQSSLSSIASVAAYESFPTFLRQSGSGLVFTLGMMGSVFAPLIFAEFDDQAGMDRVLMTFSLSSLTAATLIYLFLNETRGCELK